ncbi:hypothetical protein M8A51_23610 [Schlegelella sp. S2-27]|uniref:Uncharacterized protein n=1 Tax=Caldimonas mangrovi TaxID=2944811 RepID=A0ABT0YV99_9BURK|nr:hypothetical protein [Caldimonas mangrovi]MCM5682528.1 hypothetical protein [Caldimonas mangrovi]
MRSLITAVLLMGGAVSAQAPPLVFMPLCEDGQVVGLQIAVVGEIPVGTVGAVRWGPKFCEGKDA